MKLKGRTVLVTGGNRGIGIEVCRQLGAEGAFVLLGARSLEKGERAVVELRKERIEAAVVEVDMADRESVMAAIQGLKQPVDILVNNAALLDKIGHVFDLNEAYLEEVIHTNLIGPIILAKHLARRMQDRRWGRIVNVSSGMGSISRGLGADSIAYRLSKLALNGFTVCLAESLRGTGVLVNSVDPGWVRTEMGGASAHRTPQEGARSITWAVLIPDNGATGCFFRDEKKIDW